MASSADAHGWLALVEMSGLLVSEPVLRQHFPDGPERCPKHRAVWLARAWERYQVDPADATRRRQWLTTLLHDVLELPRNSWRRGPELPPNATVDLGDLEQSLRPDGALVGADDDLALALWLTAHDQSLDRVERLPGRWRATPQAKVERWLRGAPCPFALLTNGADLRLVHVPPGMPAAWIQFDAPLFGDEKSLLDGLLTLAGPERFVRPHPRRLAALVADSARRQTELTDALGEQVRDAVELAILALDAADRDAGRQLLAGVTPDELYRAAVYAVMRVVFLLFAEERRLLPHGNVLYDDAYGLGRLQHRLETERRRQPDTFAREADAWPQLLALFRLVFSGCPHPDLTLPAYGGDLFDPAGFAAMRLLEDERVRIPNRRVHEILRRLTFGEARVGREKISQRYSYRTLDVEHIGYLYEGLLDHRAARAGAEPRVKLAGAGEAAWPLPELEGRTGDDLVTWLAGHGALGGDRDRLAAALTEPDDDDLARLAPLGAEIAARCRPFASVIQPDEVVEPGAFYLTTSSSRRATGTHYTPIQYTRAMVQETLEPLVFVAENGRYAEPRQRRTPRELLALKVCDPAMGSGAFLVQVVRHLAEHLVEAWWGEREKHGEDTPLYLPYAEPSSDDPERTPLPLERDEADAWARRLVAERVVAGVDRNPLAVEMAKLSLWLVTLARDKPFSFLDHALRCGDSLLGLATLEQLKTWSLGASGDPRPILEAVIADRVAEAAALRRDLAGLASTSLEEVRAQMRLHARAEEATAGLKAAADLLVAAHLADATSADRERLSASLLLTVSQHLDEPETLVARGRSLLGRHRPFHWPLEYPEVFDRQRPGFDAFVGNPPFMGGQKLTGAFGRPYRELLVEQLAGGMRGSADLVASFFLRAFQLLSPGGTFGLLATNTIAEGDTRQVGLEQILHRGGAVFSAHPDEPWPNDAAVVTSRVHIHQGCWQGQCLLNDKQVPFISAFLTDREEWTPQRLKANAGIAFIGSYVLGMGFTLSEEQALEWIARDELYREVLFPYLNGEDLNTHPEQKSSRWVICFWDWSEERAREYPLAFEQVERLVKAERERNRYSRSAREQWWLFERARPDLYHAIGRGHHFDHHPEGWDPSTSPMPQVIGVTLVSKTGAFAMLDNHQVFAHRLAVFAWDEPGWLSFLQSNINVAWAWRHSSRLKNDLNYSPSDCFGTLPFPSDGDLVTSDLGPMGVSYRDLRSKIMVEDELGLTKLYNRFHDRGERDPRLMRLRELQVQMDRAVAAAYGWSDLELEHDFHEVGYLPENDRVRFTVSEAARRELLDRLSHLNRERHAEEVAQGLHEKKPKSRTQGSRTRKPSKPAKAQTPAPATPQLGLFDTAPEPTVDRPYPAPTDLPVAAETPVAPFGDAERAILDDLRAHPGWHSRADILARTGLDPNHWRPAITTLLNAGHVQRKGRKRGVTYSSGEIGNNGDLAKG
jgi:hypothetical protein